MNLYLLGIKNLIEKDPTLAYDEVRLGATFLVKIFHREIDIEAACEKYNTLEELFVGENGRGYNADSIRNVMKDLAQVQ